MSYAKKFFNKIDFKVISSEEEMAKKIGECVITHGWVSAYALIKHINNDPNVPFKVYTEIKTAWTSSNLDIDDETCFHYYSLLRRAKNGYTLKLRRSQEIICIKS